MENETKQLKLAAQAPKYHQWIYDSVQEFVWENILEVGCGIGTMTRFIKNKPHVLCIDPSGERIRAISSRFKGHNNLRFIKGDITHANLLKNNYFDTILCTNVLEHISDDTAALKEMHTLLQREGHLILFVPALQWLYGTTDAYVNHVRRYSKRGLQDKLKKAGFNITKAKYMNILGIIGWGLYGKILAKPSISEGSLQSYDKLIPFLRVIERWFAPIGLSLLVIAKKV